MTPELLPADVSDLLAGTVGPGGLPGVLADWIEERSEQWTPLCEALRAALPLPDAPQTISRGYSQPRFLVLAESVIAWLTMSGPGIYSPSTSGIPTVPRLGFHRVTPGHESAFRLELPADYAGLGTLRGLFGVSDDG